MPQARVRVYWPRHVSTDVAVLKRRLDEPQIVFKFGLISYQKPPPMSCRAAKTSAGCDANRFHQSADAYLQSRAFDNQHMGYGQQSQGFDSFDNHPPPRFPPAAYETGTCVTTCASCGAVTAHPTASFVGDAARVAVGGIAAVGSVHGLGVAGGLLDNRFPNWGGKTMQDLMTDRRS